jgi:predicted nucleotidyltransferase
MIEARVERFLTEFAHWAATQETIHAVALVGSYARNNTTETSDVDLVILANEPAAYLRERA